MKLGKLGEQIVLKSQKSFDRIKYTGYEVASGKLYYPLRKKRMESAGENYRRSLEVDELSGLFIRDILLQEIKQDDARLR